MFLVVLSSELLPFVVLGYRKKISKEWIAEALRSGCVNACLGWGGIEKDGEGLKKLCRICYWLIQRWIADFRSKTKLGVVEMAALLFLNVDEFLELYS